MAKAKAIIFIIWFVVTTICWNAMAISDIIDTNRENNKRDFWSPKLNIQASSFWCMFFDLCIVVCVVACFVYR